MLIGTLVSIILLMYPYYLPYPPYADEYQLGYPTSQHVVAKSANPPNPDTSYVNHIYGTKQFTFNAQKQEKVSVPRTHHKKKHSSGRKKVRHTSDSEDVNPIIETKISEKVIEMEREAIKAEREAMKVERDLMKGKVERYKNKNKKLEESVSILTHTGALS